MDARALDILFDLHAGLPRQGPGDDASTGRALSACRRLPDAPKVLDIGCGPGAQTLTLARALPRADIVAIDIHAPFLADLRARAVAAGVAARVRTEAIDMNALAFPDRSFDLIWSEGAAYIMGFETALAAWRPWLKPGGYLGVTELVWLTDAPPVEAQEFFRTEYPDMRTVAVAARRVEATGYELVERFVLPDSAWWTGYYGPLARKLPTMAEKYRDDAIGKAVVAAARQEIAIRRRFGGSYGYAFYVAGV